MAYFARSDVVRFAHGDHVHERSLTAEAVERLGVRKGRGRRPSLEGVVLTKSDYEPTFEVNCAYCMPALKDDPRWSAHPDEIPLTPDEEKSQKKEQQVGSVFMQNMAKALAEAAGREARSNTKL